MRITSIQLELKDQSKKANLSNALKKIDEAPESDLIMLPEIWTVGFFSFDRYRDESESMKGPIVTAFQEKAAAKKCYLHMGSFVEKEGDDLFNTSLLLDSKGDVVAKYRKIHLFGYKSKEQLLLTPGKHVTTCDTPFGVVGLSTCYDLRFPELYRKMIDQGATIFLVTSAWPLVRLEAWKLFNRVRAIENVSFLISCNCAGKNGSDQYAGHSMVVDPQGNAIAEGGAGSGFISADIDPGLALNVRKTFPALEDRVM